MTQETDFGAGSFPDFCLSDERKETQAQDGKVAMTEVGKYPEFGVGELADVSAGVESTAFGRHVAAMRARARAAGLSESEVEKISTCPLVRLLMRAG